MAVYRVPSRVPSSTADSTPLPAAPPTLKSAPTADELETLRLRVAAQTHRGSLGPDYTSGAEEARWQLILSSPSEQTMGKSLEDLRLSEFLRTKPAREAATVSAFTDWIYRHYGVPKNRERLSEGTASEKQVVADRVPRLRRTGWTLLHSGMQHPTWLTNMQLSPTSPHLRKHYLISKLLASGQPLRASPDLVFREEPVAGTAPTGKERILIVEIKCSSAEIPPRLWPNVRAQLWAYSKIDDFAGASEIILVGEVWRMSPGFATLTRTNVWRTPCPDLEEEGLHLFTAYNGWLSRRDEYGHRL